MHVRNYSKPRKEPSERIKGIVPGVGWEECLFLSARLEKLIIHKIVARVLKKVLPQS